MRRIREIFLLEVFVIDICLLFFLNVMIIYFFNIRSNSELILGKVVILFLDMFNYFKDLFYYKGK